MPSAGKISMMDRDAAEVERRDHHRTVSLKIGGRDERPSPSKLLQRGEAPPRCNN